MDLSIYDDGILAKFEEVFNNVVLAKSDGAFKVAEEQKGKVNLPLISLYRDDFTIKPARFGMTSRLRGDSIVSSNEDDSEYKTLQTMPIDLQYQIDVWTRRKEDIDKIVPELVFWLVREPNVEVDVDGLDHTVSFPLTMDEDIMDNTDIMSFESKGRIFRMTIPVRFDEVRLFAFKDIKTVLTTDIQYEVLDMDEEYPTDE